MAWNVWKVVFLFIHYTTSKLQLPAFLCFQKKSREESCGEGSGVEILENKPYTDGPGGNGQYTHKVFHIGKHIPSWFRSILPKAALRVEEESWNAYPYTRTRWDVEQAEGPPPHTHTPLLWVGQYLQQTLLRLFYF